jgi:hypothetical protein
MQIHELNFKKLNEELLTPQQIEKIFVDVEKASAARPSQKEPLGPIDAASELTATSLLNKGLSKLGNALKPKIRADKLRTVWTGMRNEPTTDNLSRMLIQSGVSPKVVRDTLRRNVPQGPANPNPTQIRQPIATPVPAPAAKPAAKPAAAPAARYSTPTEAVDALIKSVPKDWLPQITTELLKRQSVSATGSTAKKRR